VTRWRLDASLLARRLPFAEAASAAGTAAEVVGWRTLPWFMPDRGTSKFSDRFFRFIYFYYD